MIKNKLGNLVKIRTGKLDANASSIDGEYPFFTCSKESLKINSFSYDCKCVLMAGNGDLNVKYYEGKFDAYQRTYIIESKDELILDTRYLYWFLFKYVEKLRELSIGGVIKYIKLNNLTDPIIPLPPLEDQKRIVKILDEADALRQKRKEATKLLDDYLKSVFLEMFGDQVKNERGYSVQTISDVALKEKNGIKAGPFGSSLKKEFYVKSGYKIYGQEQVIKDDFNYGDYYINEERYRNLESCKIQQGDILISLVGTFGKISVVPEIFEPGIINPRLMKITPNQNIILPQFLKELLASQSVQKQIKDVSHGGTMGIVNVGIIKKIKILVPSLDEQKEYIKLKERVELVKQAMCAQSEELEIQFQALIQKAFKSEL
jgi:type I restriction enzyme S subunit